LTALTIAVSNGTDSGIEDEAFISQIRTPSALRRVAAQITRFGAALSSYPGDQIADHIGGSCATIATGDCHAARLAFQRVSEPNAEYLLARRHLDLMM
jgi:hypothetical protein